MDVAISIKDIRLGYKMRLSLGRRHGHQVLNGATFEVRHGETLGILGRNGAGKSTLLKILAGILDPDAGTVTRHVETVSLLSLNLGLDPNLSGEDNAVLGGLLLGHSPQASRANLKEIREFSELGDSFLEPVKTYSSGMYARLGFSIALHQRPDVLLIDEILGVGDAEFQKKSGQALQARIKAGQTAVLVSHNTLQIKALCKRAIWIEHGVIKVEGESAQVLTEYERALLGSPSA